MPIYEYDCPNCGYDEDIFPVREGATVECPECAAPSPVRFAVPVTIGVVSSNTIEWDDAGVHLRTRKEQKEWEKGEGSRFRVHEPGSASYKAWKEKAQGRLDHHADRMGYKNWEHQQQDRARKRDLEAGVDTPNVLR
ncbi:hypothetical protein CMI37_21455 [Candidatus Pacearchaeota archaeon]|nr:hypothetical protein [Candidatus Pacearchaeota archaeon]|tara:strand:- start:343 stop:753 length:411 start_codon:yes stop_codon:yes gene_type:complete